MIEVENWGIIDFLSAWKKQEEYVKEIQRGRKTSTLILCEHPTVITIGRNGTRENILLSDEELDEKKISFYEINRGGDVTLHAPEQIVGYTLFDLKKFREDLHWFLREIEQCIIELISEYGIIGGRVEGKTGVWIEGDRKICAIGIHCSRWVTSHGFALNVNNDLRDFEMIIPCGIADKEVTSIKKEILQSVDISDVNNRIEKIFRAKF